MLAANDTVLELVPFVMRIFVLRFGKIGPLSIINYPFFDSIH